MKYFLKLAAPPLVVLPIIFILMPTALGALLWQVTSTVWLLFCIKRSE